MADRVEKVILGRIGFLAGAPDAGHWRKDLSDKPVKFFPVYSYLIVLSVAIPHGRRNVNRF
jgi:hypothetical protein